ncbi:MAG: VWA domain-containing protein, partial [Desulfobacterales bacterium]|nr:VWA domain-containing protein [Desulfobacterales bacterium]
IDKYDKNSESSAKFLSLESKIGIDKFKELKVTVSLPEVSEKLNRYISAILGINISTKPLSSLSGKYDETLVCSDGRFIYLPDEIDFFDDREKNSDMYKSLTRLEASLYEFGTFDVDLEQFFSEFNNLNLVSQIFTMCENIRIIKLLRKYYPGFIANLYPLIQKQQPNINEPIYIHISNTFKIYDTVFESVRVVREVYPEIEKKFHELPEASISFLLFSNKKIEKMAQAIYTRLKAKNINLIRNIESNFLDDSLDGNIFWYKEWNYELNDYLQNYVRLRDRVLDGTSCDFYFNVMNTQEYLIKKIKYSFELLKPEALSILRKWVEGDDFDYNALIEFAVDKKANLLPSDHLYIKKIKNERDISVLLLVDLSRSTANLVYGSNQTVLDVEKEAIVLFCEALEIVGDSYSIAGFSGTGRLGVDYFRIKDFNENMGISVREKICGMSPQRSTRMGAAIRHAISQLEQVSSKIRLLIILGDGFPNDLDYKKDYAIYDTRKAILEAYSKNIIVRPITINVNSEQNLDKLYGNNYHSIISDIRDLPSSLLKIYTKLTHK